MSERFPEPSFQKNSREVIDLLGKAKDEVRNDLEEAKQIYVKFHNTALSPLIDETGISFIVRRYE